ncbi:hypothetical protein [Leucothrix arctica]|uniref:2'-5' RNA ligase n=1 Tax=Leucothrix arctica TaxID=1481894 RepID=A0A317C428_9GAMM|nr:hypothetical protein [Leucothrix arctica]PWQ93405.1 hypothetical protein DKT75_17380 [Leucothrix arctica]
MKRTVFYIKPNEESANLLQSVVNDLAKSCDGPSFSPHLTFYTGKISEDESPGELLRESIKGIEPLLLTPKEIKFEDFFTRSFYLSFELSESLKDLNSKLKGQTKYPADYELNPHLSLAYTSIPVDIRRALAKTIDKFNEPILFDRVGALETPDTVNSYEDIKNSKNIATFSFD